MTEPQASAAVPRELQRLIGEAIGEASMAWTEAPGGEFDTDAAGRITDRLIAAIGAFADDARREMVVALDEALHHESWARPVPPAQVWEGLLAEVREIRRRR
jgi:hypothetical protein